ncbi:ribonuclease H-like domain-containing protein [Tanacetum coccineum]|uniref:Ribonuclease H-like domain-containing protein n=1 Tax=Tanacetum coccineum TaxID=301880 RepID=A0ABQ5H8V9_9ASTR
MITRSQSGIVKPIGRLSLHTLSLYPIPKSTFIALKDPNWCNAMYDEYNALVKNGTWILVPRSSDVNLVNSFVKTHPSVNCIDDLDFFKDFESEFSGIVYNDALTSKSDFSTEPTLRP